MSAESSKQQVLSEAQGLFQKCGRANSLPPLVSLFVGGKENFRWQSQRRIDSKEARLCLWAGPANLISQWPSERRVVLATLFSPIAEKSEWRNTMECIWGQQQAPRPNSVNLPLKAANLRHFGAAKSPNEVEMRANLRAVWTSSGTWLGQNESIGPLRCN